MREIGERTAHSAVYLVRCEPHNLCLRRIDVLVTDLPRSLSNKHTSNQSERTQVLFRNHKKINISIRGYLATAIKQKLPNSGSR